MAKSISAGLLMYSNTATLRVMLAHPGGPYFAKKDEGAWTIPKGLVSDGEELLTAAKREFIEETGYLLDDETDYLSIGNITLKSGKVVHGWAFAGDWEAGRIPDSNTFCMVGRREPGSSRNSSRSTAPRCFQSRMPCEKSTSDSVRLSRGWSPHCVSFSRPWEFASGRTHGDA